VLNKLRELAVRDEDVRLCEQAAGEQAAELDRLEEAAADYRAVDLRSRGISETQARDLRARLRTFAEDWDRPEAAIYDEDDEYPAGGPGSYRKPLIRLPPASGPGLARNVVG